jgi:hypothetical protein
MKKEKTLGIFLLFFLIISMVFVIADFDKIYSYFEDYPWDRNNTIENPVCYDRLSGIRTRCGIQGRSLRHYVDESTGTYYYSINLTNLHNETKTIEFELYGCRCDESEGNPRGICQEYWPFIEDSSGDHREDCIGFGLQSDVLEPYQEKEYKINYSQYMNEDCGSFQADLHLFRVNGVYCPYLMGSGVALMCHDCYRDECEDFSESIIEDPELDSNKEGIVIRRGNNFIDVLLPKGSHRAYFDIVFENALIESYTEDGFPGFRGLESEFDGNYGLSDPACNDDEINLTMNTNKARYFLETISK